MEATLSPQPSFTSRINVRLIVLLAVVATPFCYFAFVIARDLITGGIIDRGSYVEVELKAMGNFYFDPTKDTLDSIPPKYRQLDGRRVLLEGEMFAPDAVQDDVRAFQLVYSIQKCCFDGPPKVQERVFAKVPAAKQGVSYANRVRVLGTLHVNLKKGYEGETVAVYEMDVESVEPM